MIRVALETATAEGSVAVARDDRILREVMLGAQSRHAESALPALDAALREAGIARSAIGAVVVGAGPGSFTGVRVAGATAKGLVAGLGVPLVAYPSLLALAAGVPSDRPVCALLDARRGEVYAGCWAVSPAGIEERLAPVVAAVGDVVRRTASFDPVFAGDGALRYRAELESVGAAVHAEPAHPLASTLLRLAHRYPDAGRVDDVAAWEPLYVRASSAERGVRG